MNKLENRITIINDNIKNLDKYFAPNSFDVIVSNPPYFKYNEKSNINESIQKTIARHEKEITLSEIVFTAKKYLNNNGIFAMVHRTDRLIEIIEEFKKNNIEPKRIRLVYPKNNEESNMVLIEGRKNGNTGLKILPPLIAHKENGDYSDEVKKCFKKGDNKMKLIVGLGNPGKEYENTRHNIGFIFLDYFANKYNINIDKEKYNGLYAQTLINDSKVILLKPQSYMNLSGEVVKKFVDYFKINVEDILIINDDLDMTFGKIRLRPDGSSGGHNGLKNIALHLNTEQFKRLKIGISNDKTIDTKDYVLGKFSKDEKTIIDNMKENVSNILFDFINSDFDKLMCKYNKN